MPPFRQTPAPCRRRATTTTPVPGQRPAGTTPVFRLLKLWDTSAPAQGRVCPCSRAHKRMTKDDCLARGCNKHTGLGYYSFATTPTQKNKRVRRSAAVCCAISRAANFLGPIWIYHVVCPAIGAMHITAAGSPPATPRPASAVTTVHFT